MGAGVRWGLPFLDHCSNLMVGLLQLLPPVLLLPSALTKFRGGWQANCESTGFEMNPLACCSTGNPGATAAGLPLLAYDVIYASLLAEQGLAREAMAYVSAVQVQPTSGPS